MKSFIFFLKQGYIFFKQHFYCYILCIVTISISISSILYLYTSIMESKNNQIKNDIEARTINLAINKVELNDVIELLNEFKCIENVTFYNTNNESKAVICAEYNPQQYYIIGDAISSENIDEADSVVVVSKNISQNESIILNKHKYQIIGIYDDMSNQSIIMMPYTTMFINNIDIDIINIRLKNTFSQQDIININNYIKDSNIKYSDIQIPDYDEKIQNQMFMEKVLAIILYLIVLINFFYFYYYMYIKKRKNVMIYRLLGLSVRKNIFNLIIDDIIVFSISYIFGVIICNNFFVTFLQNKLFMNSIKNLSFNLYMEFYIYLLFLTCLFSFIVTISLSKKKIFEFMNKSGD